MALACENIEEQLADAEAKGIRLIDKTREVANNAAAQRDDHVVARELLFGRALEKLGVGCWVLALLAGLKGRNAHGQPGLFQPLLDGRQEQRADVRAGDDECALGLRGDRLRDGADLLQEKGADVHLIGVCRIDVERVCRGCHDAVLCRVVGVCCSRGYSPRGLEIAERIARIRSIVASNSSHVRACGPSDQAFAGSSCTSISSASAPAAQAASAIGPT